MTERGLRERFLKGLALAAAAVNAVTAAGPAGRAGVTVSAMTSGSAGGDAPTLPVCVHYLSAAAQIIIRSGCFCANILRDDQICISDAFAGRGGARGEDKSAGAEWRAMAGGALRPADSPAAFDRRVKSGERFAVS